MDFRNAELSLVLTDDPAIWDLNRQWRDKDRPTDVLSFPQTGGEGIVLAASNVSVLGDVVISMDTAARQAVDAGLTLEDEVRRLMVHGVLHLLGHDHVHDGTQAQRMQKEEDRLLAMLSELLPPSCLTRTAKRGTK